MLHRFKIMLMRESYFSLPKQPFTVYKDNGYGVIQHQRQDNTGMDRIYCHLHMWQVFERCSTLICHQLHNTFSHHTQHQSSEEEDNLGINFWMSIFCIIIEGMDPTCDDSNWIDCVHSSRCRFFLHQMRHSEAHDIQQRVDMECRASLTSSHNPDTFVVVGTGTICTHPYWLRELQSPSECCLSHLHLQQGDVQFSLQWYNCHLKLRRFF